MDLKKRDFLTASLLVSAGLAAGPSLAQPVATPAPAAPKAKVKSFAGSGKQTSMVNAAYKPRRINKAIELWEDDQPVFYTTYAPTGLDDGYEMGKAMAKTWCDAINYECEQGVFDLSNLRKFMQGLVDGGPTPSGHRTPMVFVSSPVTGNDEASINANAWVLQQILAAGAHAIDLCHARDAKAVEAAIAALRYAGSYPGVPPQAREALRGNGSERFASHIWGVTGNKYIHLADFWPLNPRGELAFGVKIEDKVAHANMNQTLAVPGVFSPNGVRGTRSYRFSALNIFLRICGRAPAGRAWMRRRTTTIRACNRFDWRCWLPARPTGSSRSICPSNMILSPAIRRARGSSARRTKTLPWPCANTPSGPCRSEPCSRPLLHPSAGSPPSWPYAPPAGCQAQSWPRPRTMQPRRAPVRP